MAVLAACNNNQQPAESTAILDTVSLSNKKFELAFENEGKITTTSIDTLRQVSFGGATDPAISPDGNQLAYTVSDSSDGRSIWLANMETKMQEQLKVNSKNFYQAVFSPDGQHIAYSLFKKGVWKIGIIGSDNRDPQLLDVNSNTTYYAPTWKGNEELAMHDLDNLYVFGLDGKLKHKFILKDLIGANIAISSNDRFFYSADGKSIIFNAGTSDKKLKGVMGSGEAIYKLDLADKKVAKISPDGYSVASIFLTPKDKLFFSALEKPFKVSKIYTSTIDGEGFKLLVDKGSNPSAN